MRHISLHMDVYVKFYDCDINNKQDIAVQKIKMKKSVLNLLFF